MCARVCACWRARERLIHGSRVSLWSFQSGRFHSPASNTKSSASPASTALACVDKIIPSELNVAGIFWHPYHQWATGRGNDGLAASTCRTFDPQQMENRIYIEFNEFDE